MILQHSSDNSFQAHISAKEMVKISDEISRKFSPVAPSKAEIYQKATNTEKTSLSTQELLQASNNISLYYAPKIALTPEKLTLLSIDPQHIYIYWSLGKNHSNSLLQTMHENELVLKIHSLSDQNQSKANLLLEVPVHHFQHQKIVKVPAARRQTMYSASIGKLGSKNSFFSLVRSNELHIYKGSTVNTLPSVSKLEKEKNKQIDRQLFFNSTESHFASGNHSGQRVN